MSAVTCSHLRLSAFKAPSALHPVLSWADPLPACPGGGRVHTYLLAFGPVLPEWAPVPAKDLPAVGAVRKSQLRAKGNWVL